VVADATITRRTVSIGAGGHGVAVVVGADALVVVLAAEVADITDPA
jgi:dihydroxyacetone kinase